MDSSIQATENASLKPESKRGYHLIYNHFGEGVTVHFFKYKKDVSGFLGNAEASRVIGLFYGKNITTQERKQVSFA